MKGGAQVECSCSSMIRSRRQNWNCPSLSGYSFGSGGLDFELNGENLLLRDDYLSFENGRCGCELQNVVCKIMTHSSLGWTSLIIVLCLATFGPWGCLLGLVCLLVFLLSVFATLFLLNKERADDYWHRASISRLEIPSNGIPCVRTKVLSSNNGNKFDKRLTGSSVIDEHLQEVLQLTLRDHVLPWYRKISDDEKFPQSLQESAQQIIISFAKCVKDTDWVQFFTIQLVEDFASHFRLFRESQHKLCEIKKKDQKGADDVTSVFFELESEISDTNGWKNICLSSDQEKIYLRDLVEVLLYLLLPLEDFKNKIFRYLIRELIVNTILLPTLKLLSDPDYINQTIVWLCKDVPVTSEGFITVLRLTSNVGELLAVQEKVNLEIALQRSKDSGGDDDAVIKQQLSSLLFVKRVVDHRLHRLQEGVDTDSAGLPARFDWKKVMSSGYKLCSLPLDVILKNNVALSYFIDFMMCTGQQSYLFFYLTVEGYRVSAEQQISQLHLMEEYSDKATNLETLREAAQNIYEQYLSPKVVPKMKIEESLVKRLLHGIQHEIPSDTLFDEIQNKVKEILLEDGFYGAFKKSSQYIKMLAELDLLKDTSKSDDDDIQSLEDLHIANSDSVSISSSQEDTFSDSSLPSLSSTNMTRNFCKIAATKEYCLKARIVGTGLIKDAVKPYIVYAVEVIKMFDLKKEEKWQVYRRYSDFHDFHMTVLEKFCGLPGHAFPAKKTFNNMSPEFLGKRMQHLNDYLLFLLKAETLAKHPGLQDEVLCFLKPVSYSRDKGRLTRKMNRVVNPIKESVRNMSHIMRSVPDNVIQTVDYVMDGLCRVLHGKTLNNGPFGLHESLRMTAGLDLENDEDIPLRILLVLADEVFDLKSRNQWLRRRIVILLREFIRTMYGDRINRKILDYVEWLISADQIAEYIKTFRNTIWPNGCATQNSTARDENTRFRSRVAAKMAMLCFLPDEMKHIIGSETIRKGVHLVFEMFQQPALNHRLLYELLERVLKLIFPNNNIPMVLKKLHLGPKGKTSNTNLEKGRR